MEDLNRHFFQRRYIGGQKVHGKVLTNHQGNANQNQDVISPHTCQYGFYKKKKKTRNNKHWQECREKGALLHYRWECKLVQPLWKTVSRLFKKLKVEQLYGPAIPLWVCI